MPVLDWKSHSGICQASRKLFQGRVLMYSVTPVFTQVMDFMSLKTFQRCVERYRGNFGVKNFTCLDQFRTRGFAQLTYRESLPSSTKQKTLSHGHPQQGFAQHSGGSERDAGLAYLRRFRPSSDRHCQEALPEGTLGRGTEEHGLRLGCYDDRPVSVHLSLGTLPGSIGAGIFKHHALSPFSLFNLR